MSELLLNIPFLGGCKLAHEQHDLHELGGHLGDVERRRAKLLVHKHANVVANIALLAHLHNVMPHEISLVGRTEPSAVSGSIVAT